MAFAKGTESKDFTYKQYVGIAPLFVTAINPNMKELNAMGIETSEEPVYTSTQEIEGTTYKTTKVDIHVKSNPEKCGLEFNTRLTFFLTEKPRFNKDNTKVQIIDKYGRTAWGTVEEVKAKQIPQYTNSQALIDSDYRPCMIGEEALSSFIKTYLNIPNCMTYNNGNWEYVDNLNECEARLDNIKNYFNGDYSELKQISTLQPNNQIKVMLGVRTTDEGKEYQTFYNNMFLRLGTKNYTKIEEALQKDIEMGRFSNVTFLAKDVKEFSLEATEVKDNNTNSSTTSETENGWF